MPSNRLPVTKYNECLSCGVAYDMGFNHCRQPNCKSVIPKQTKYIPKKYKQTRLPLVIPQKPEHIRFMSLQARSEKRGFGFNLTEDYVKFLLTQPCHYCFREVSIEIDRKDNENGYLVDNVVPACRRCNMVKNHYLMYEQMITVAEALGWR